MTRINVVSPSELTGKHLVAEYREIVRVFSLVRKAQEKGKNKWNLDIPSEYTLGTGHVKFFYNKLSYILDRYQSLIVEMLSRGYKPNPVEENKLTEGLHKHWFGVYLPKDKDIEINRQRIKERM